MASQPINIQQFRKVKSRARVLDALEHFQAEALTHLTDENNVLDLEAFEEFMAQVLGDHLTGQMNAEMGYAAGQPKVAENYRRFSTRLKKRLQSKMKAQQYFEPLQSR
jgi:hypothetical protein